MSLENENQRLKTLLDQLQKQVARQQHNLQKAACFKQDFAAMCPMIYGHPLP